MRTIRTENLKITVAGTESGRICYVLYPLDVLGQWIEPAAAEYHISIAVITGLDWNNDLTPWPAKGEPPGCPDFKGNAPEFLSRLASKVLPTVESKLHIAGNAERTLAGVSLSGLFTLWQWMICDTFRNIISLSGSFWYDGFVAWIKSRPLPPKSGKAYFLLGDQEARTRIKAFQPVQTDTEDIVSYLSVRGIDATLELVPGNHYQYAEQRLDRAFTRLFTPSSSNSR